MHQRAYFLFSLQFVSILSVLLIAVGLLHYGSEEQHHLQVAEAMVLPKQYLYTEAVKRGIDYDLLSHIVECESGWRMIKNAESSAFGYFQILDRTEQSTPQYLAGERKDDPIANIEMGLYLFERYGTSPWEESKPCWGLFDKPAL